MAQQRTEIVERKGIGHPDSMCDALVETASLAIQRLYLEKTGVVLHSNLDKALLAAGEVRKGFGWGEIVRPMKLIVGDRATLHWKGTRLPVEDVAREAIDRWVGLHLPHVRAGSPPRPDR